MTETRSFLPTLPVVTSKWMSHRSSETFATFIWGSSLALQIYGLSLHDWTMSRSQHELLRKELAPQEVFDDSATSESRRSRMKRVIAHSEEIIVQRIGIRPTESTVVFAAIKGW